MDCRLDVEGLDPGALQPPVECALDELRPVIAADVLGEVHHRLAGQNGCEIEEEHALVDHIHMLISVPPKLAVLSVVGYIKDQETEDHRLDNLELGLGDRPSDIQ